MKEIEDNFQNLTDQIIDGLRSIDTRASSTVTKFFALWYLRFQAKLNPIPDQIVRGVAGEPCSRDQQEFLEKQGLAFVRSDQTMPGRSFSGLLIQRDIDSFAFRFEGLHWAVGGASGGEFILPDSFGNLMVVPITPSTCLVGGHEDSVFSKPVISKLNQLAVRSAREYYIARDFTKCPL